MEQRTRTEMEQTEIEKRITINKNGESEFHGMGHEIEVPLIHVEGDVIHRSKVGQYHWEPRPLCC